MTSRDRLARLYCVNTLFHRLTGHDLYLADQMLAAIEAAQAEGDAPAAGARKLDESLRELHERLLGASPDAGFAFCDGAAEAAGGPLWMRAELISALRRNAPYRQATVMVANLAGAPARHPKPRRGRTGDRLEREHADDVAQLREAASRSANPHSLVTLLFV